MIPLWLRGGSALTLIFTLMIAIILVQPHDDSALYDFFTAPQDCAAPCFMGIRPGVTRQAAAFAILQAHPWVGAIERTERSLNWKWNGQQPAFIQISSSAYGGAIAFDDGIATRISMTTTTPWGDFLYAFGLPNSQLFLAQPPPKQANLLYTAFYLQHGFAIQTTTDCSFKTMGDFWSSPVNIMWPIQRLNSEVAQRKC